MVIRNQQTQSSPALRVFIGSRWFNSQLRPGGHDTLPAKPIDVSAFSYSKRTAHQNPLSFLKRGTGNGGTVIPFGSGEESSSSSGGATKGGGGTRASARAAALKKTKLRDFQVLVCATNRGQKHYYCSISPKPSRYLQQQ